MHEQVLRTDLNNSEIRYKMLCNFLTGVHTHPTHLAGLCLRHRALPGNTCIANCGQTAADSDIVTIGSL